MGAGLGVQDGESKADDDRPFIHAEYWGNPSSDQEHRSCDILAFSLSGVDMRCRDHCLFT
jgi:hypothetical protein